LGFKSYTEEIALIFLWFIFVSLVLSVLSYPLVFSLLKNAGAVKKNYRGETIPGPGGIVILLVVLFSLGLTAIFFKNQLTNLQNILNPLLILVLGMGFLGLLDDLLGTREVGGFRGHFGELGRGELTTGLLKAAGGGVLSLYVASFYSPNFGLLLLNSLVLAFFTNTLNLLDLRPGRAAKVFLTVGLLAFLFSFNNPSWIIWGFLLPPVLVLFYTELREQCMIGDVGSNILGAILGFTFVVNFTTVPKVVVLFLLLAVQVYAERYSITELVDRVSFLKWFDELGRKSK